MFNEFNNIMYLLALSIVFARTDDTHDIADNKYHSWFSLQLASKFKLDLSGNLSVFSSIHTSRLTNCFLDR